MKKLHILFYTGAAIMACAAIISLVEGSLAGTGLGIFISVALYLSGRSLRSTAK